MSNRSVHRWSYLKIAIVAIPIFMLGLLILAPVIVGNTVEDPAAIGGIRIEPDYRGAFKINWPAWTLIWSGIGMAVYGIGRWINAGLFGSSR